MERNEGKIRRRRRERRKGKGEGTKENKMTPRRK
jgi:hypothetical protein